MASRVRVEDVDGVLRTVLADVLALSTAQVRGFDDGTRLFGALPELDSMAVASLLAEMEERLAIRIEDHEVSGDLFGTYGALRAFAEAKVGR